MGRVMKACGWMVCLLLLTGVARGAFTTVSDTAQWPEGSFWWHDEGVHNATYYRFGTQDWGWDQQVTPPAGNLGISSAILTVRAYDVESVEVDRIYGDGVLIGELDHGADYHDQWHVTTLSLGPAVIAQLADGEMEMWIDIDATQVGDQAAGVTVDWSTLAVTYLMPESVVPAPGAILLGALGAGLVGWLRKRGTL